MKITIVGIGRVGSTLAFSLVMKGLAEELVLINRSAEIAEADALDLAHASAFADHRMSIRSGEIADSAASDIIVVTVSVPYRKDLASRAELAEGNAALLRELVPRLAAASPEAILLIVTNPVDSMTYLALQLSGFPPSRVLGAGTLLDSGRFRALISREVEIHPDDIRAYILGEHGDTQFPALSLAIAGGVPITGGETMSRLFDETVRGGYDITSRKGYTNYAIALATTMIIESIVQDERRTIPVSVLIDGYQGEHDVCLSVPTILGKQGVLRRLEPPLSPEETAAFHKSAAAVRATISRFSRG